MAEYVFSYTQGTNQITTRRDGSELDWKPIIPGLTVMATFAKRVFYADLVKDIKRASNSWINEKGFIKEKFEWQIGYGAFSYGKSQIERVCKYIANQKSHHNKLAFKKEFVSLLELFAIPFKEEYLFEFYN